MAHTSLSSGIISRPLRVGWLAGILRLVPLGDTSLLRKRTVWWPVLAISVHWAYQVSTNSAGIASRIRSGHLWSTVSQRAILAKRSTLRISWIDSMRPNRGPISRSYHCTGGRYSFYLPVACAMLMSRTPKIETYTNPPSTTVYPYKIASSILSSLWLRLLDRKRRSLRVSWEDLQDWRTNSRWMSHSRPQSPSLG